MTATSTAIRHPTQGVRHRRRGADAGVTATTSVAAQATPWFARAPGTTDRGHDASGFAASLTGVSEHTRRAYTHDVDEFVAWCERGGCPNASDLDHRACGATSRTCRRAAFGKAIDLAQGRVGARVRPLPASPRCRRARRRGAPAHRARPEEAAARPAPRRRGRAARPRRRRSADDAATIRGCTATSRCSSSSTAPGLRVSECCGLDVDSVDLRKGTVTVLGKGSKVRRLPLGRPGLRRGRRLRASAPGRRWSASRHRPCS